MMPPTFITESGSMRERTFIGAPLAKIWTPFRRAYQRNGWDATALAEERKSARRIDSEPYVMMTLHSPAIHKGERIARANSERHRHPRRNLRGTRTRNRRSCCRGHPS